MISSLDALLSSLAGISPRFDTSYLSRYRSMVERASDLDMSTMLPM